MAEAPIAHEAVERYALEHTTAQEPALAAMLQSARRELPSPAMLSGPVVGRLLELLVFAVGAHRVLEIGTYAGYSALSMAGGLGPGGQIITCEISSEAARVAREHIGHSAHADRIEIREGPALATIAALEGPFDLVFIDADKTGYGDYYEAVLPLLAPRGLIVLDNTLRAGRVLNNAQDTDEGTQAIVALNRRLAVDERIVCVLLTVRDGVTLIRRR